MTSQGAGEGSGLLGSLFGGLFALGALQGIGGGSLDDVHEQQLGIVLQGRAGGQLDATGQDLGAGLGASIETVISSGMFRRRPRA